ncbi:phosphonate ABC transporter, permease protein PhnE [Ramlibacter sp. H39-3-26]|uniref:phosphonate ABC transporter, permease protein PhnE n=1 Tax=Curvibacter soli TaxID=3031331 RepID=UPI0023D99526|nr:phosphonate ABC transporter, permease protein PhnE [Ramlibacter sp. H39-3-26]MDF1484637.1 phosphonate ABC transporter, permease protein PhnE [Ramlibacter sp. H39-3-26]
MNANAKSGRAVIAVDVERLKREQPGLFPGWLAARGLFGWSAGALLLALVSMWWLEFSPARFLYGLGRLFDFARVMLPPETGGMAAKFLGAMAETLAMAFLGTGTAALVSFPIGFLAARNVIPNVFAHFAVRRVLDAIRGVDVLIWALLWVNVVGLGPFAGVLAIACSDMGSFGKLFSEAIENIDRRPVEGVISAGGGALHVQRYAILPQVLPVIGSQVLYFFESNTRSASILGIVGAGGIGIYLTEEIRVLNFPVVTFIVILILITVMAIDFVSEKLRLAMIGRGRTPA